VTGSGFDIEAHGTPDSVRVILSELRSRLDALGLTADQCGRVEIALAEALNNIVEHAYAGHGGGPVRLHGALTGGRLEIGLRDEGRPLPGLRLPDPQLPGCSGPVEALPEGGFGWYLIHDLTDALTYRRNGAENWLCLGFQINSGSG